MSGVWKHGAFAMNQIQKMKQKNHQNISSFWAVKNGWDQNGFLPIKMNFIFVCPRSWCTSARMRYKMRFRFLHHSTRTDDVRKNKNKAINLVHIRDSTYENMANRIVLNL